MDGISLGQSLPKEKYTFVLTILVLLWLCRQFFRLASFIHLHLFHRSTLDSYNDVAGSSGSSAAWALVTGASDGIGKGFAEELCYRGFNVIIHGRDEAELNSLRGQLLAQWPQREIKTFVLDAGQELDGSDHIEQAVRQFEGINLTVLINNVGGRAYIKPRWASFSETSSNFIRRAWNTNAGFTMEMTRALLPQLEKRRRALVINVGSISAELPTVWLAVYSGAKGFLKSWSRSLHLEMKLERREIEFMHVMVGMVSTGSEKNETSLMVPSSRPMAASSLDKVGCGQAVVFGYWPHELQFKASMLLPTWMLNNILAKKFIGLREEDEWKAASKG